LFRTGDAYHPDREGSKTTPNVEDLPPGYGGLLNWYRDWSRELTSNLIENDPLLKAQGSGKNLWADEPADEYVRRLAEGWELAGSFGTRIYSSISLGVLGHCRSKSQPSGAACLRAETNC